MSNDTNDLNHKFALAVCKEYNIRVEQFHDGSAEYELDGWVYIHKHKFTHVTPTLVGDKTREVDGYNISVAMPVWNYPDLPDDVDIEYRDEEYEHFSDALMDAVLIIVRNNIEGKLTSVAEYEMYLQSQSYKQEA